MAPPTSGPPIMARAITPAIMPWYLPRSRGGIRSPMIAMTPTIRPPAPRPCIARKPISWLMSWAIPLSAEPIRKITMEARKTPLRPYRSPSLPQIGVEAAVASVYAVTTHDRCSRPPSSPTIVGMAVPTIMLSSIASSIAIMSASSTIRTLRGCGSGLPGVNVPADGFPGAAASSAFPV